MKKRIDLLLVEQNLVPSREKAQALILAGKVQANGQRIDKSGRQVDVSAKLEILGKDHPYVSRGGVKLESALDTFDFSPHGLVALDIGASTGGFTHCLLLNGAHHVYAVDVGYGQLAWELQQDSRVTSLERTNIRKLDFDRIGTLVDLVVIDASFISLRLIFPKAWEFLKPGGHVIALVKPQFEAGKSEVGKGGLVSDHDIHARVMDELLQIAIKEGFDVIGRNESTITGKKSGNKEFFLFLTKK